MRVVTIAYLMLVIAAGCSSRRITSEQTSPAAAPTAVPEAATTRHSLDGVSFAAPSDWSSERLTPDDGLLLTAPALEDQWPANVFFEERADLNKRRRSLEQVVDDLIPNLRARKARFELKEKRVLTHPDGFQYGRVSYTAESEETALGEWEVVIPLGESRHLFVLMSAAQNEWTAYEPVFAEIIDSIKLPQK